MNQGKRTLRSLGGLIILLIIWGVVTGLEIVPRFMLPSPCDVLQAGIENIGLLLMHAQVTLVEAFIGLGVGILLGLILALLMERFELVNQMVYPLLIISQTIPTIAIAPLLVLWFGYDMLPKIILVVVSSLFPIAMGLLDGFRSLDPDIIFMMRSMKATDNQIIQYAKLPYAIPYFFSSLRISVTYAIVGAVVAEWLGGESGLGVYMTRARKSYAFDEMFAIIIFTTVLSLLLIFLVNLIERLVSPWIQYRKES